MTRLSEKSSNQHFPPITHRSLTHGIQRTTVASRRKTPPLGLTFPFVYADFTPRFPLFTTKSAVTRLDRQLRADNRPLIKSPRFRKIRGKKTPTIEKGDFLFEVRALGRGASVQLSGKETIIPYLWMPQHVSEALRSRDGRQF